MKQLIIILSVIFSFSFCLTAQDNLTGRQIAEKMDKANQSKTGLVVKGEIELKDLKNNKVEKRKTITLSISENQLKKSLFRFTDSSYKGTTFLSIEKPNKDFLQYIYLKSVGSPRQVESSDKENNFVDTDVSNEDMGGGNINDYTYNRLEDKKINNLDCYTIERVPVDKNSKYEKHLLLVEKQSLLPIAVKSYNKAGRVVKIIKMEDIRQISPFISMAYKITVTSIEEKHQTTVQIYDAKEQAINIGYFNKNRMNNKWTEE